MDIKRCPFCGSKVQVYDEEIDIPGPSWRPHCTNSNCILAAGTVQTFASMADLQEAWSERAALTGKEE